MRATKVDGYQFVEAFGSTFEDVAAFARSHSGVIDEEIQPAVSVESGVDERFAIGINRNVAGSYETARFLRPAIERHPAGHDTLQRLYAFWIVPLR